MLKITIETSAGVQEFNFTDQDEKVLLDMVSDIADWISKGNLLEKISNHKDRIVRFMTEEFVQGRVASLSQDKEQIVADYFARVDYQNKEQRETALANNQSVTPSAI